VQQAIPAVWMRGGTSKGLFFHDRDLPQGQTERDALLLRAIGSPDPYRNQMDGLGGATSSTSKVVIISASERDDCDIDYFFGHVPINGSQIDTSGNCGNLSAAVGPFAIDEGLVAAQEPITTVRIWQANIGKRIVARVPVKNGIAQTQGDFVMDGVAFSGAAIELGFEDVGGCENAAVLPTGNIIDTLDIPGIGQIDTSLINAGNAAVFIRASDLGLSGTEKSDDLNKQPDVLAQLQTIRAHATVAMGLAETPAQAEAQRPATPKIHWLGPARAYETGNNSQIMQSEIDLCARALSMGRAHHAYPGTSAVATAVAAAIPGSIAQQMHNAKHGLRIGHAAGSMEIHAHVLQIGGQWTAPLVQLKRSARRLMRGTVFVP